ncbi:hypothetical protein PS15m_004224 [Mucor circinelloides]
MTSRQQSQHEQSSTDLQHYGRQRRSARSPLCPQGILSKAQVIRANLGDKYKAYTRKLGFDNCVSDTYIRNCNQVWLKHAQQSDIWFLELHCL